MRDRSDRARAAPRSARRLKMKELERATGVGREAIRFYIREGLLPEPERLARNVALYDESFVERIRLIKRLQTERFLPLGVIKGVLGAHAEPSDAEVRTLLSLDGVVGADAPQHAPEPEALPDLARRVALAVAEIRELARVGAVEIVVRNGRAVLEGASIEVVELWAKMRAAGFSAELGFAPADIALPVQITEWLAREQLRMFTSRVTGRVDDERARVLAEVGLECVVRLTAILHRATLLRRIATGNVPAEDGSEAAPPRHRRAERTARGPSAATPRTA